MRIDSFHPFESVEVKCDGTVPMVIRFNGYAGPLMWAPKYWRTGDFKHSLIEVAVDPVTGTVCKIVVTSLSYVYEDHLLVFNVDAPNGSGIPTASLTMWENDQTRVDDAHDVKASLVERAFTVIFGDVGTSVTKTIKCGRVSFLISRDDELQGFQVDDLSDQEVENIRYATGVTP